MSLRRRSRTRTPPIPLFRHASVLHLDRGSPAPEVTTMIFVSLLLAILIAMRLALVLRSWPLMGIAVVLSLPFVLVAHIPYLVSWLLPCLRVAAVALRWRVGVSRSFALFLAGLVVGIAGGPGVI